MVQIGGYNLNVGSWFGSFTGFVPVIFFGMVIAIVVGVIALVIWMWLKNKSYKVPCKLLRIMENGTKKELAGIRGKTIMTNSINDFEFKIPGQRKTKKLGYMPDFSLADANGLLAFVTEGDGTLWQQMTEEVLTFEDLDINGRIERRTLLMKPIPTENKTVTINNLTSWKQVMDKSKLTAFTIAIAAFIIMVIAHLVSLYVQTKIRCPGA